MKQSIASLQERLADWNDWDVAAYELGACLGFWKDFGAPLGHDQWNGLKHVFWSNNPLGNCLNNFLENLVRVGVLEKDNTLTRYRWNPNYQGEFNLLEENL